MNSLKNVFILAILAAVAYGVYLSVNKTPSTPPPEVASGWSGPVQVDMGTVSPQPSPMPMTPSATAGFPAVPGPTSGGSAPLGNPAPNTPPTMVPPSSMTAAQPPAGPAGVSAAVVAPVNPTVGGANPAPVGAPSPRVASETASSSFPTAEIREEFCALLNTAHQKIATGNWEEVHRVLTRWYGEPKLTPAESAQLTDLLDQVAGTVIYSRQPILEKAHEVQPGETLPQIADSLRVPWELLAKINRISNPLDPQCLHPGQKLKVVRGPFHAVVYLESRELLLTLDDRYYAGRFPVGIGTDHPQLEGNYAVKDKVKNPTYYGPNGVIINPDDPHNPLGERWIGLGDKIGLHGTNDPQNVGRTQGAGCICLSNRDIDDVFDILSVGSRVYIRR